MAGRTRHSILIPEALLHAIWSDLPSHVSELQTIEGYPLTILSPGTANEDEGPDFTDAKVRLAGTLINGDVEIHRDSAGWAGHGHHRDPHYNRTILHVVWKHNLADHLCKTESGRRVPVLELQHFIPAERLTEGLRSSSRTGAQSIPCYGKNRQVPCSLVDDWIDKVAWERTELKIRLYGERLRQLVDEQRPILREPGNDSYKILSEIPIPMQKYERKDFSPVKLWDQLLYEGILEALGYSKNRIPFLILARSLKLEFLKTFDLNDRTTMSSILFGVAGLLPSPRLADDSRTRSYVLRLQRRWEEIRPTFKGTILHQGEWKFFRLRPANFPTARIAAFASLLPHFFAKEPLHCLIDLFKNPFLSPSVIQQKVHLLLQYHPEEYWLHHYHFGKASPHHTGNLGRARRDDIIVNVILPVLFLYARVFNIQDLRSSLRKFMLSIGPLQQNSVTKRMEHELLGDRRLRSAIRQQGVIRLYKCYCARKRCKECAVGRFLESVDFGSDSG